MHANTKHLLAVLGALALSFTGCDCGEGEDLCADVTCGDNAHCAGDVGECVCDTGFSGDPAAGCTAEEGLCQDDTCSGHGVCDDSAGMVVCACDTGYTGATC